MNASGNTDLLTEFRRLLAINNSQQARLEECAKIINSRDSEIAMLQAMISEAASYRSSMDFQLKEFQDLQLYLTGMQQHSAIFTSFTPGSQQQPVTNLSAAQQLQGLQLEYASLKSQLSDREFQLLDLNQRNLLLQQQNSRIAELESLLENTQQEVNALKSLPNQF